MVLFGSKKSNSKPVKLAPGYHDPQHPYRYTRRKVDTSTLPVAEEPKIIVDEGEDDDDSDEKDPLKLDETELNTKLNALLYHTSDDSVALYKNENTSSDLLGRLYYDNYDSDTMVTPLHSGSNTPILTPTHTGGLLSPNNTAGQHKLPSRPSFSRGISFDTSDDHRKSLTLKVKHPQFKFRRNNNTFLTGFKNDEKSIIAIEWLFDEMVIHGDSIVVLHVLDEKQHHKIDKNLAKEVMEKLKALNIHSLKISLTLEIVIGKTEKLLKAAIAEYKPAMMILGTHRTNSEHHKSLMSKTSFSKHFMECALVPVILVKPDYEYWEYLESPIERETYFEDLLKNIDIKGTFLKKYSKKKHLVTSQPQPVSTTTYLSTNQTNLSSSHLRNAHASTLSPSHSRTDHSLLIPDRGRRDNRHERDNEHNSSSVSRESSVSRPTSRSTSRSRSATRIARFFGRQD